MGREPVTIPGLEDTIRLALQAHRGQRDKAGQPYILHPLRVMLAMDSEAERMTAVLHDVVEDSRVTLGELRRRGFPKRVVAAVDALTRRQGETYEAFIQRLKPNPLASKVKLADLKDNMDLSRLRAPKARDLERLKRYRKAWKELNPP